MRYFEQKDYPAIAARLGCSEAAARSHVSKAVATLKRKLATRQERDHGAA
jgi:DNA-directed RNA polymerase specialized sigma24 family protein